MNKGLILLLLVLSLPFTAFSDQSAIEQAEGMRELADVVKVKADLYNVECNFVTLSVCDKFLERARKNTRLLGALLTAKKVSVKVVLNSYFEILSAAVLIDTRASDQTIIQFLLGK